MKPELALQERAATCPIDVRFWHKADIATVPNDVRFRGKADVLAIPV